MPGLSWKQVQKAIQALIDARTWNEAKHIVEAERDKLLTDTSDRVFANLLDQYRFDAKAIHTLEVHRDLLARCRHDGIEAAFADYVLNEMQTLLDEIDSPTSMSNLPYRAEMCRNALQLVDRNTQPQIWAGLQHNLAGSLALNLQGERADNLEQAIDHYKQALEVYTPETFPEAWAATQNNLAKIYYYHRIHGERADNLEQAIDHYKQALEVYTPEAFPEDWAEIQFNLALSDSARIHGERADNLEQAIDHYKQALEVYTPEAFPEDWAKTQHNLANIYYYRIHGERVDNQEQTIHHYTQALKVHTRRAFPQLWATLQNDLANVYNERIRGEQADNLEQAIQQCLQALKVRTRQAFPEDWAETQDNLAMCYYYRIRGERADNLEQAIHHYMQALKVRTRQAFSYHWAWTQHNLAFTYYERIGGKRADNIERAIHLSEQVLEVHTRQAFPEKWAGTQHNLAGYYYHRIHGKRADNLEQAIHHYTQALEVYTPEAFPDNCRKTAYLLGCLLYEEHRFTEARHVLITAHQSVEALRGEVQRDTTKRSLAEESADLYAHLVFCCLQEGDVDAAFKYAVAGKGRAFVDLLASARLDLSTMSTNDPDLATDQQTARALQQQLDNLRASLTGESNLSFSSSSDLDHQVTSDHSPLPADVLRAQLRALQTQAASYWEEMAYKYPALTATQKAPALSAEQARTLAVELDATLVEYYQHTEGWCAFVVTSNAIHYVPLPLLDDNLLERMVRWMLRIEKPKGLNPLSYLRLSEWHDAVIAPLQAYLPQEHPIVLAPFGILHVLPLAAARHPLTGRYVGEDHQLAFVPSLAALSTAWNQVHRTDRDEQALPRRLLSVAYPGVPNSSHYLPDVLPEAKAIAGHFAQVTPLYEEKATPDAVVAHSHGQDVIHFGCHGWFDAGQPEQSGLLLAGGWLTVQRIITELRLEQARLVTLGACLSGRAAIQSGDEHVGLLQAMLSTSVQAVVASLWSVDDVATRAFFEAFYAHLAAGRSPARALQEAAQFVRERPGWAHPYYWAAFQVSGLAYGAHEPVPVPMPSHLEGPVNIVHQGSTRGERPMNTEQSIEGALDLLEQMSEDPNEVRKKLDETQQAAVMRELDVLAERAASIQSVADLLGLADAIHRLVEDQLGLRSLLLPEGTDVATERSQRTVTMADHLAATGQNTYAQERAPQMRNAVIEARTQLEAALQKEEKPKHKHDGEKSDDDSHE